LVDPEKQAAAKKRYNQSEKGQQTRSVARKRFREANLETEKARSKQWYEANKGKAADQNKAYHESHREQVAARKRAWQASKDGRYSAYRCQAKTRGIDFQLSKPEFLSLWDQPCHYCNNPIEGIGVDRVDSSGGYALGNVVACCGVCNRMKLDMTTPDFTAHLRRILAHLGC